MCTVVQHVHIVHFEVLGVSWLTPDLINRPTAYCCSPGNFCKGVVLLGLNGPRSYFVHLNNIEVRKTFRSLGREAIFSDAPS